MSGIKILYTVAVSENNLREYSLPEHGIKDLQSPVRPKKATDSRQSGQKI